MSDNPGDQLALLVEFTDPKYRELVIRLLSDATRPEFDDDLDEWEKPLFDQLEDVEYPDEVIEIASNQLFIHWYELDDTIEEINKKMKRCGGIVTKAQIFLGDIYTDNTFHGMYYRRQEDQLVMMDPKVNHLKMPEEFPEKDDYPQQMQALLQDFG